MVDYKYKYTKYKNKYLTLKNQRGSGFLFINEDCKLFIKKTIDKLKETVYEYYYKKEDNNITHNNNNNNNNNNIDKNHYDDVNQIITNYKAIINQIKNNNECPDDSNTKTYFIELLDKISNKKDNYYILKQFIINDKLWDLIIYNKVLNNIKLSNAEKTINDIIKNHEFEIFKDDFVNNEKYKNYENYKNSPQNIKEEFKKFLNDKTEKDLRDKLIDIATSAQSNFWKN